MYNWKDRGGVAAMEANTEGRQKEGCLQLEESGKKKQ